MFQTASTLSPDAFFETTVHVPTGHTGETGIWEVVTYHAGDNLPRSSREMQTNRRRIILPQDVAEYGS